MLSLGLILKESQMRTPKGVSKGVFSRGFRSSEGTLRAERLARAVSREARLLARERDGQELLVLHKQGREAAALDSVGADGIAAPHGKGRARCAAAGPEPEGRPT